MSDYQYVCQYADEEIMRYNSMITRSSTLFPYTLAIPLSKLFEQISHENYGRGMNYALDFFEMSSQMISCFIFSILKKESIEKGVSNEILLKIIDKIDTKRSLSFGDWVNDILTPLVLCAIKTVPEHPLVSSLSQIINKKKNLYLGDKKNPSIVQIRNEYKGHSTMLSESIYKGVIYTIEPRILQLVEALSPLADMYYFTITYDKENAESNIVDLRGTSMKKSAVPEHLRSLSAGHYYVCAQTPGQESVETVIDLYPLLICNENGYIYLFQTLKGESINYISSNENAVTYLSDIYNDDFDAYMQQLKPSFDIAQKLNWDELRALTITHSRNYLDRIYREKKYNNELFVDRTELTRLYKDFINSSLNLFPLIGEAGQGKTNQLCYWTESLVDRDSSVLFFQCSDFTERNLEEQLKLIFAANRYKSLTKILSWLHEKAEENNENVYFFFDAVNECHEYHNNSEDNVEAPLALYRDIRRLLVNQQFPRFKILFTCRSYTWKNLLLQDNGADEKYIFKNTGESEICIRGFSNTELEKAYDMYRKLYQMDTPFSDLCRHAVIRLKDPLVLKMTCTNYLGMKFPSDTNSYTSLSLFEKMFNDIRHSYAGNAQCDILQEISLYILNCYEHGKASDGISIDQLNSALRDENSPLHNLSLMVYKKDALTVAYTELLNKPERPILRMVKSSFNHDSGSIQFIYERFLEYSLARVFVEREISRLPDKNASIPAEVFVEEYNRSARNVVFAGVMRNAIMMDYLRTRDTAEFLNLTMKYGDNYEIMLLLTDCLNVLIQENYETEVFELLDKLIETHIPDGERLTLEFNEVNKKIDNNEASEQLFNEHGILLEKLSPQIRMRKLAYISTINGMFLTDYFNESLYEHDPYALLWQLMQDDIYDVRNDTCLYVYYLSNKKFTASYTPLKENLTEMIVHEMFRLLRSSSLVKNIFSGPTRKNTMVFLEISIRISVLLIIDALLFEGGTGRGRVRELIDEISSTLKHFTLNYSLVKLLVTFIQPILRKQITFQASYVNNAIEYETFWDNSVVPQHAEGGRWSHEDFNSVLPFIMYNCMEEGREFGISRNSIMTDEEFRHKLELAYNSGDSFSYFVLERILVIVGNDRWDMVAPFIRKFFAEYRDNEWFDYSQMSILYVLFQMVVHAKSLNGEIMEIYARECEDWTKRCRGLFKAHNSYKANPDKMYKRNVMNWYCVVYCLHTGDNVAHEGDERCVPVFYKLIDEALDNNDKELLYHLIENILELTTDYGFVNTSLGLLKHILGRIDSVEKLNAIDDVVLERNGVYKDKLITFVGKTLGTMKNYFPAEVDNFIRKDLVGLNFPGLSRYQEDLLNYNPSGESLSDLFTHRFGKFLMWALVNESQVDKFAFESMSSAVNSSNSFKWYDNVIRITFRYLFNVKL